MRVEKMVLTAVKLWLIIMKMLQVLLYIDLRQSSFLFHLTNLTASLQVQADKSIKHRLNFSLFAGRHECRNSSDADLMMNGLHNICKICRSC